MTTAGSKTSTRRVTKDCSAPTISQATGMGSAAWCGIEACPPRPRTVIVNSSAEAMIGPGLVVTYPPRIDGDWWMAKAYDTASPPSVASSRPSPSATRAPWRPSSPGWKKSRTRPASDPRRSASRRVAPTSMAVWASWPQACMQPSTPDA